MKPAPLLLAAGLGLAGLLAPLSAQAAAPVYGALGDSYSAGTGTRWKVDNCYRSPEGYPQLVATANGWTLNYQACSGATIPEILANQVPNLAPATNYVTVTGGGNDAGFVPTLTECAKPGWMSNCNAKLDQAEALIAGTIPGRLDQLYSAIKNKAPQASKVVVGYPRIFNGEDCNALTWFSPQEEARMNALVDKMDSLLATKASAHGFGFSDPRAAFTGHAVCDRPEYINGLSMPIEESYHPNDAGNRAYATLVTGAFGARTTFSTMATTASTSETVATATAQDYAQLVPDLVTEENLAKAELVGLNRGQLKKLDRELRSGDVEKARKAFHELKRLDRETRKG